jgi:hypothetical protein
LADVHEYSQNSDKSLRISSTRGHNDNLHFRESSIISRPAKYLMARSNHKIPPTINPLLFRSNTKHGRRTDNIPFALAYSHENHDNNNDDKFGLEKMSVGDNTKTGAVNHLCI